MSSQTSPHNNISPADTPLRPSRVSPAPPIDLGARGIAEMDLPPTLHQEKITLTPPRPSRAPTLSARDVEVQGIANMALPPTPMTTMPSVAATIPFGTRTARARAMAKETATTAQRPMGDGRGEIQQSASRWGGGDGGRGRGDDDMTIPGRAIVAQRGRSMPSTG